MASPGTLHRVSLGLLLAFAAMNAFAGGVYALSGAPGVPTAWLAGSPFRSYFVPGMFLLVVVGGSFAVASVAVFARTRFARPTAAAAGLLVLLWLAVQVAIIGYASWMQPTTAAAGVLVLWLARRLPVAPRKDRS